MIFLKRFLSRFDPFFRRRVRGYRAGRSEGELWTLVLSAVLAQGLLLVAQQPQPVERPAPVAAQKPVPVAQKPSTSAPRQATIPPSSPFASAAARQAAGTPLEKAIASLSSHVLTRPAEFRGDMARDAHSIATKTRTTAFKGRDPILVREVVNHALNVLALDAHVNQQLGSPEQTEETKALVQAVLIEVLGFTFSSK